MAQNTHSELYTDTVDVWSLVNFAHYMHCCIMYDIHMLYINHTHIHRPVAKASATNIKLTNVWMMLRKCCNHPYLLEFPMTPDGQFRVDEELVTCCGKLMLLDRLLPALISQGHKVG